METLTQGLGLGAGDAGSDYKDLMMRKVPSPVLDERKEASFQRHGGK